MVPQAWPPSTMRSCYWAKCHLRRKEATACRVSMSGLPVHVRERFLCMRGAAVILQVRAAVLFLGLGRFVVRFLWGCWVGLGWV